MLFDPKALHGNPFQLNPVHFKRLATRNMVSAEWESVGPLFELDGTDLWFCYTPEDQWTDQEELVESIKSEWDEKVGDRRQEIVIIGIDMDKEKIKQALDSCLLTDEEFNLGEEKWKEFEDPYGPWTIDEMEEEEEEDEEEGQEEEAGEEK